LIKVVSLREHYTLSNFSARWICRHQTTAISFSREKSAYWLYLIARAVNG